MGKKSRFLFSLLWISVLFVLIVTVKSLLWWEITMIMLVYITLTAVILIMSRRFGEVQTELASWQNTTQMMIYDIHVASDRMIAATEEMNRHSQTLQNSSEFSHQWGINLRDQSTLANTCIERAFEKMNAVKDTTGHIESMADQMNERMSETKHAAGQVVEYLDNTDHVMADMKDHNHQMRQKIEALIQHVSKIEEINAILINIVDETALLSLNASIESAKAGEHGKGFSVIATRIRQLADQSKDAVVRSSSLLEDVLNGVKGVEDAVEKENQSVSQGISEVVEIKRRVNLIFDRVVDADALTEMASASSYEQIGLIHDTAGELRGAVEMIEETIKVVELTLLQEAKLREQVGALNVISDKLLIESGELLNSISAFGESYVSSDVHFTPHIEKVKGLLAEIAALSDIVSLDTAAHARILEQHLQQTSEIQAIWSNRSDGTFIFSKPEAGLLNAKQREWWRGAIQEGSFISDVYVSAITKRPCLTIATSITNVMGERIGVIGADLSI